METDTAAAAKVHEYYNLSCAYLKSAQVSLEQELYEPAMFTAIHALELALKAALLTKSPDAWKTHNVGGQFGRYFRRELGEDLCRRVNILLARYNLPRYPSEAPVDPSSVHQDIAFIEEVIKDIDVLLKRFS